MAFWIFKRAEQDLYPDVEGKRYVYDNTHSVKVKSGDQFLYLDKSKGYSFTAVGSVSRVKDRSPTPVEAARRRGVRAVYTAELKDVAWFTAPFSISPRTEEGRRNRAQLGITDVNLLGWSQSIPSLGHSIFSAILEIVEQSGLMPVAAEEDFSVPDAWSVARARPALTRFVQTVIARSNGVCIVCGTRHRSFLEAAHLSPYATDEKNRANPANGVCLCTYCHRALDLGLIAISPSGELLITPDVNDEVARFHFDRLSADQRSQMLTGVDPAFLQLTVNRYRECLCRK